MSATVCTLEDHERLKASSEWAALPRLRKHGGLLQDHRGVWKEWKNCPRCKSTLVRALDQQPARAA